jgi:DNA-binding response OmpR family regulator
MKQVLVIDDEPDVADLLRINFRAQGQFTISAAADGVIGLQKAREESPLVIVLDLMLPRMSGFEVCKILKADAVTSPIPILFLTARADVADRLRGFELGAADYVTKPFSPREVVLRIGAIAGRQDAAPGEGKWSAGNISVNSSRHEVTVGGKPVRLTAVEFRLLSYLIQTRGRVQSRDQLLNKVWEYSSSITTRTVDAHVVRLRRKLGRSGDVVETVRTYGYRFRETGDREK